MSTYFSVLYYRHNDFALTRSIASNVTGKTIDIVNQLGNASLCCRSAYTSAKGYALARDLAMKRAEDQL